VRALLNLKLSVRRVAVKQAARKDSLKLLSKLHMLHLILKLIFLMGSKYQLVSGKDYKI